MKKEMLSEALLFATEAHHGQFDKAGMPYILHPIRVAETVKDMTIEGCVARKEGCTQIAALLHDVVEDTDVTLEDIRVRFGPLITDVVDALTKRKHNETYRQYLDRIRDDHSVIAIMVKLADMADNSRPDRLAYLPVEKQVRLAAKYARGRHYLLTGQWYENKDLDRVIKAGYRQ